jgi:hypothetical protein
VYNFNAAFRLLGGFLFLRVLWHSNSSFSFSAARCSTAQSTKKQKKNTTFSCTSFGNVVVVGEKKKYLVASPSR